MKELIFIIAIISVINASAKTEVEKEFLKTFADINVSKDHKEKNVFKDAICLLGSKKIVIKDVNISGHTNNTFYIKTNTGEEYSFYNTECVVLKTSNKNKFKEVL